MVLSDIFLKSLEQQMTSFFDEDELSLNSQYMNSLPQSEVECELKVKSDLVMAGLPFFAAAFCHLGADKKVFEELLDLEGQDLKSGESFRFKQFKLPFSIALSGERVGLNLLSRACSVATTTFQFRKKIETSKLKIALLDTRKTTPGLRGLEKYAVKIGGGENHRFSQSDVWMIKDNHKNVFGGLTKAHQFFKKMGGFYRPLVCEVHDLKELKEAIGLSINHVMLDNFSPDQIHRALELKSSSSVPITFEVSGGVDLSNIENYLIKGVDAISVGALTHSTIPVDISFKYYV